MKRRSRCTVIIKSNLRSDPMPIFRDLGSDPGPQSRISSCQHKLTTKEDLETLLDNFNKSKLRTADSSSLTSNIFLSSGFELEGSSSISGMYHYKLNQDWTFQPHLIHKNNSKVTNKCNLYRVTLKRQ